MSLADFLDEEELNEHESAWRMKNWDKIDELVGSYKADKDNSLFDMLGQLNDGKQRVIVDHHGTYDKFFIDNAMSQHVDTIYPAYVMNLIGSGLSDQAHFDYYLEAVRKGKRFGAWAKLTEDGEEKVILAVLSKHYGINTRVAMEYHEELIALNLLDKWKRDNRNIARSLVGDVVKNKTDQKKVDKIIQKW